MALDLEEIITKNSVLKKYRDTILRERFPEDIADTHPDRGAQKLAVLADFTRDIANLLESEIDAETAKVLLQKSAHFITTHTKEEINRYAAAPYIEDSLFAALTTAEDDSKTPLESILESIADIDAGVVSIVKSPKAKKYKRSDEYRAFTNLKEFFDKKSNITEGRRLIIKASMDARIQEPRRAFEKAFQTYSKDIQQYEENGDLLAELGEDEYIAIFQTWNPGLEYKNLSSAIEREKHLPPQIKAQLLRKLENTKTQIQPVVEAAHIWLSQEMQGRIESAIATLKGMIDYNAETQTINITSSGHIDVIQTAEPVLETLTSGHLTTMFPGIETKQSLQAQERLKQLKEKVADFRVNESAYAAFAEVAVGKRNPLQNVKALTTFAHEYHRIYGLPSWKSRTSFEGIDAQVEQLRKDFLSRLNAGFVDLATTVEEELQQQILSSNIGLRESAKMQQLKEIVMTLENEAKDRDKKIADFHTVVSTLPGYQKFTQALQRPGKILEARGKIIGASRKQNLIATDYAAVLQLYKETLTEINTTWNALDPEQRGQPIIEAVKEQVLRQLQGTLARRVSIITKTSADAIKEQPESWLRIQMSSLEEIISIVQNEDLNPDILTKTKKYYEDEIKTRNTAIEGITRYFRNASTNKGPKRIYILDTNVLLSDPDAVSQVFGPENQVVILADVLTELNRQKETAAHDLAFRAREAIRAIQTAQNNNDNRPFPIMHYDSLAKIRSSAASQSPLMPLHLWKYTTLIDLRHKDPDEAIIFSSIKFKNEHQSLFGAGPEIIFVSKDVNARLRAVAAGLTAEPYMRENISVSTNEMYEGFRVVNFPPSLWADLKRDKLSEENLLRALEIASDPEHIHGSKKDIQTPFTENEFVIAPHPENPEETVVLRYRYGYLQPMLYLPSEAQLFPMQYFHREGAEPIVQNLIPRNIKQVAALDLILDPSIYVTTLAGAAGTGKTLLAVASGLSMVQSARKTFPKLYLTMPLVELDGGLGYLKGSLENKLVPRFRPVLEKAYKFVTKGDRAPSLQELNEMVSTSGLLEMHPFSYMRGMSVQGIRVLDEAQNTNPKEMKTFITRAEDPSKTIVCGDPYQIDDPGITHSNGFAHLRLGFLGEDVYGHISLETPERGIVAELGQRLLPYTGERRRK